MGDNKRQRVEIAMRNVADVLDELERENANLRLEIDELKRQLDLERGARQQLNHVYTLVSGFVLNTTNSSFTFPAIAETGDAGVNPPTPQMPDESLFAGDA